MMDAYYVIETQYVGPQDDSKLDYDRVEISTLPALANLSGEPVIEGWAGTTNDVAVYGRGEYDSLSAARRYIGRYFEVRETESDREEIVESYKIGAYEPLGRDATRDWVYPGAVDDVRAGATAADLDRLAAEYSEYAEREGFSLDREATLEVLRDVLDDAKEGE